MDSLNTYWADRSALEWQIELGADEAICDTPTDRYDIPDKLAKPAARPTPAAVDDTPEPATVDPVAEARQLAAAAQDLDALQAALATFEHCTLKRGARNTIFRHGDPAARVMVISEAPDRDADRAGTPFAGPPMQLLDRMFDAIGMGVKAADGAQIYLASPTPWRSPAQSQPKDLAMTKPFLERHITLANPDIVILMGNTACQMLLGQGGVSRLRGTWTEVLGRPALPMLHPAALMRTPTAKRDAWADLLALQAKLKDMS